MRFARGKGEGQCDFSLLQQKQRLQDWSDDSEGYGSFVPFTAYSK
jgi:hypothetical protein